MTSMVMRKTSSVPRWRNSSGFTAVLTSAVLEWLLILLLFVNALFSYLVTKLARFCELETPCVLCSRLDHLFGHEIPGFYLNLICGAHKLELSSLVFCHVHNKLADVYGMCEGCLCSFATEKKFNSETVGTDVECRDGQDPLLKGPLQDSASKTFCSCCKELCRSTFDSRKMVQLISTGSDVPELDIPVSASVAENRLNLHDGLNRREEVSGKMVPSSVRTRGFATLSHIGYKELKIISDSESEVPLSDGDEHSSLVRGPNNLKDEDKDQIVPLVTQSIHPEYLPKTVSGDLAPEELIHQVSVSEPSLLVSQAQHSIGEPHDFKSLVSESVVGLEELNSHQVEEKPYTSPLPELISLQDVPSSSTVREVLIEESADTSHVTETDVFPSASVTEIREICEPQNGLLASPGPDMRTNQVPNERGPVMTNLMDLSDAYKLVISSKGNQASSMPELTPKDSTRVSGDIKLWLSQISSSRGFELSLSEISPRVYGQWEDLKMSGASSPIGLQILQKRISLERNTSGFESLDGSIVSEVEGESVVDRLKRQVEYDRKSMNALYKELEEERNASAVAANQALAMITRLQEEKATLQMEALQYLRMMEEQAEYDVDALQKANVLLAEKEKELQDLEAKLKIFKEKFPCESMVEKTEVATCDSEVGDMRVDHLDVSCFGYSISTPCNTPREQFEERKKPDTKYLVNGNNDTRITEDSSVGFEDERSYITQRLKKLEKKLHLYSNNGFHIPHGGYSRQEDNGVNYERRNEEDRLSMKNDSSVSTHAQENYASSLVDLQFVANDQFSSDCEGKDQEIQLVQLEHEVSNLNERLKALEADRNFLEHTINSLRTGDGIHFIQEIAHDLRELRRIGIRREQAP